MLRPSKKSWVGKSETWPNTNFLIECVTQLSIMTSVSQATLNIPGNLSFIRNLKKYRIRNNCGYLLQINNWTGKSNLMCYDYKGKVYWFHIRTEHILISLYIIIYIAVDHLIHSLTEGLFCYDWLTLQIKALWSHSHFRIVI